MAEATPNTPQTNPQVERFLTTFGAPQKGRPEWSDTPEGKKRERYWTAGSVTVRIIETENAEPIVEYDEDGTWKKTTFENAAAKLRAARTKANAADKSKKKDDVRAPVETITDNRTSSWPSARETMFWIGVALVVIVVVWYVVPAVWNNLPSGTANIPSGNTSGSTSVSIADASKEAGNKLLQALGLKESDLQTKEKEAEKAINDAEQKENDAKAAVEKANQALLDAVKKNLPLDSFKTDVTNKEAELKVRKDDVTSAKENLVKIRKDQTRIQTEKHRLAFGGSDPGLADIANRLESLENQMKTQGEGVQGAVSSLVVPLSDIKDEVKGLKDVTKKSGEATVAAIVDVGVQTESVATNVKQLEQPLKDTATNVGRVASAIEAQNKIALANLEKFAQIQVSTLDQAKKMADMLNLAERKWKANEADPETLKQINATLERIADGLQKAAPPAPPVQLPPAPAMQAAPGYGQWQPCQQQNGYYGACRVR